MIKKLRVVISVFALALMGMSISASAEDIEISSFRNVVTGVNTNVTSANLTASNLNVQKQVGWQNINNTWYYFNESGVKQTGWLNDNGTWYYFESNGVMAHDTTVNGYYLGSNGTWTK